MPRPSRGSEVPQRQSPRGSLQLRTSSSDSDNSHHRPIPDRSPKLGDRCSPRGAQSDSVNQKKLGTRIADLESQLGQAQEELKHLKEQLVSAEAAKKVAQEKLEKKSKTKSVPDSVNIPEKRHAKEVQESNKTKNNSSNDVPDENEQETDVFEVPVEKVALETQIEVSQLNNEIEKETKAIDLPAEPPVFVEPAPHLLQLAEKENEINLLKGKLLEKEKELEVAGQQTENLKKQLDEATMTISSAQSKEEEMASKLCQLEEELKASKENNIQLKEKLEAVEGGKEELEAEMKKLRVQTEQWKKAADAAAAVLAGGVEMNGRIPGRCGSMDKHFGGVFEVPHAGYAGFVGSPGNIDDLDDGFGGGKRKNSGIRMFGDLWKKRGQK
ncbi:hypothetical protein BT93_F2741 [Corymbia citriodora subsp. variegata]|nr:hypothetical protein BT93_F2741 [Corymbia citriodora subsp. variegata]KAF8026015.1 hypothetical protein BT93_F2741 [Corymbia citriodora subsp. variegata]KAF8026016.1 hypothetical protein BT93_F2741 [Corymbia citriodora subsp. variegata]